MTDLFATLLIFLAAFTSPIWMNLLWYPGEVIEEVKFRWRDWRRKG